MPMIKQEESPQIEAGIFNEFLESSYKPIRDDLFAMNAILGGIGRRRDEAIERGCIIRPELQNHGHRIVYGVDSANVKVDMPGHSIHLNLAVSYSVDAGQRFKMSNRLISNDLESSSYERCNRIASEAQLVTSNEGFSIWDGSLGTIYFHIATAARQLEEANWVATSEMMDAYFDSAKKFPETQFCAVPKKPLSDDSLSRSLIWLGLERNLCELSIAASIMEKGDVFLIERKYCANNYTQVRSSYSPWMSDYEQNQYGRFFRGIVSCYYKPHDWGRPFRIEWFKEDLADRRPPTGDEIEEIQLNDHDLMVLATFRDQTSSPHIVEPYSVFIADRTAKQVRHFCMAFDNMGMDGDADNDSNINYIEYDIRK